MTTVVRTLAVVLLMLCLRAGDAVAATLVLDPQDRATAVARLSGDLLLAGPDARFSLRQPLGGSFLLDLAAGGDRPEVAAERFVESGRGDDQDSDGVFVGRISPATGIDRLAQVLPPRPGLYSPQLRTNDAGQALLAYTGGQATRPAGGSFGAPSGQPALHEQDAALDGRGGTLVAGLDRDLALVVVAGQVGSPPPEAVRPDPGARAASVRVAAGADGTQAVLYDGAEGVALLAHGPDGSFGPPMLLAGSGHAIGVGIDARGRITAAWTAPSAGQPTLEVADGDVGGPFARQTVAGGLLAAGAAQLAVNAAGDAVIAFTAGASGSGGSEVVEARLRPAGGAFGPPARLTADGTLASLLDVAIGPGPSALVLEQPSGPRAPRAAHLGPDGFGPASPLPTSDVQALRPPVLASFPETGHPTVAPELSCTRPGQPVRVRGTGFRPGARITIDPPDFWSSLSNVGVFPDGSGAFAAGLADDPVPADRRLPRVTPLQITATEAGGSHAHATTVAFIAPLALRLSRTRGRRGAPTDLTATGLPHRAVVATYRHGGRVVARRRLGTPAGPCGVLRARATLLPVTVRGSGRGHWTIAIGPLHARLVIR